MRQVKAFDFDNTLVKQPTIYEWRSDCDEEDNEYMESTESLDYEFEINKTILKEYKKASKEEGTILVLLTNRTNKLKKEILAILKEEGITFDYHLFRKEDRSKGNRLVKFLKENADEDIEEVYFWDDKDKHLEDVDRITKKFKDINFHLNKVEVIN